MHSARLSPSTRPAGSGPASCRPWPQCALPAAVAAVLLLLTVTWSGPAAAIERRQDQFPTEPSYLVLPLPYSIPGIGEGFFIPLLFSNIAGTHTDAYALMIVGDAEGQIAGVEDVHLMDRRLLFQANYQHLNRAVVNNYETRGMTSAKDDYSLIDLSKVDSVDAGLTLTFFERRLEFSVMQRKQSIQVDRLLDHEGNLLADLDPPYTDDQIHREYALLVDYTDDHQDPRRGVRFRLSRGEQPSDDPDSPEFYVRNAALTGYIPLGQVNTLALHYFRSDAIVTRAGQTDLAAIKARLGLNCGADPVCLAREDQLAQSFRDANLHGTAESLGGEQRMRAYPDGRFQGAHTMHAAAELRWNLTQEVTPFDYFIWKDVRTSIQLAMFYEVGSVSETSSTLGDEIRSDYGVGLRMLAGSGEVYRIDAAKGDEGAEITVIVDYPF